MVSKIINNILSFVFYFSFAATIVMSIIGVFYLMGDIVPQKICIAGRPIDLQDITNYITIFSAAFVVILGYQELRVKTSGIDKGKKKYAIWRWLKEVKQNGVAGLFVIDDHVFKNYPKSDYGKKFPLESKDELDMLLHELQREKMVAVAKGTDGYYYMALQNPSSNSSDDSTNF